MIDAHTHTEAVSDPSGCANGQITPASAKLCSCLMAAVEAETYARRRGLELRFSSEDIRTMAKM